MDPELLEATGDGKDHQEKLQNYLNNRLKDYFEDDSALA